VDQIDIETVIDHIFGGTSGCLQGDVRAFNIVRIVGFLAFATIHSPVTALAQEHTCLLPKMPYALN